MSKAIGMVEYKTVSAGITATDAMVKTSEVSIIEAQTVCPGKYIAIITGDLSAVKAAVDNAKELHGFHLIDSFVLGNPHESIFPAIYGGMCGKSYMLLTGEVAAVEAAIERAKEAVKDRGMFLDSSVIAHPDAQIRDAIL